MTDLAISEVFGPTIQGEGPSMGMRAGFVRTARCNLTCRWCDTPYTWDWKGRNGIVYDPAKEVHPSTVDAVAAHVEAMDVPLVVFTGGEPLLQATALTELARVLTDGGMAVEVETNGTRLPLDAMVPLVRFNVSPKLAHAKAGTQAECIKPDVLARFAELPGTAFKFVAQRPTDLAEVADVVAFAGIPRGQVWVMPEGIDTVTLTARTESLADAVIDYGWNLSTRLHVLMFGNQRGV